jgi:hypothetical protein
MEIAVKNLCSGTKIDVFSNNNVCESEDDIFDIPVQSPISIDASMARVDKNERKPPITLDFKTGVESYVAT